LNGSRKGGDWYYFGDDGELHLLRVAIPKPVPEVFYSAPRLDRMLAEIEKRGFIWALDVSATNGNKVIGYAMNIATSLDWEDEEEFRSDSPEEAAAPCSALDTGREGCP